MSSISAACSNPDVQKDLGRTGVVLATLTVALGVIALFGTMWSGVPIMSHVGQALGRVGAFAALGAGGGVLIGSIALLLFSRETPQQKEQRQADLRARAAARAASGGGRSTGSGSGHTSGLF